MQTEFPGRPTILSLALLSALTAQTAAAEETALSFEPVEVVGSVAPAINSVDSADIEKIQANDLEDLFSQSPEVSVGGGVDIAQKLYIRGVEDPLLNISIDGATQATKLYHHNGRIAIEPELLKRVDVQAGAGNALSGPGALGGSVKFVTKDPADMLAGDQRFGGMVKGGYFSNTDSFKTNTSLYGRLTDDWSAMVSFTEYEPDEYEDGEGNEVEGTSFEQDFLFAKLVGDIGDSQTLRLSYERRRDEGERTSRPQWIVSGFNQLFPMNLERETVTLNYAINPADNPWIDTELTLFHTDSTLFQNGRFGPYQGEGESEGFDLRNTTMIANHTLTYGIDYRRDTTLAGPETNPDTAEEKSTVKGLYIQDDIAITSALELTAGMRYDDYALKDNNDVDFDETELSYNVGVNYQLTERVSLFASYAEAFKGPLAQDAFKLDGWRKDPNLKPEDADNTEVGVAYDSGTYFGSAKVYRSNIDDLIADPLFGESLYQNVGDLESDGYLLEVGRHWQNATFSLSYHHNDAEVDGEDANGYAHGGLANTIGDTLIAQLDYQLNPQWTLGWNGRFVKGVDSIETFVGEIDKPGYARHDVYAQWRPAVSEDIRVSLSVRNLFDKYYLDHASNGDFQHIPGYEGIVGAPEPGRDIRLNVAWQF